VIIKNRGLTGYGFVLFWNSLWGVRNWMWALVVLFLVCFATARGHSNLIIQRVSINANLIWNRCFVHIFKRFQRGAGLVSQPNYSPKSIQWQLCLWCPFWWTRIDYIRSHSSQACSVRIRNTQIQSYGRRQRMRNFNHLASPFLGYIFSNMDKVGI